MSTTPNENTKDPETPLFDPFPEPKTMPSGWDLSGFTQDAGQDPATTQVEYKPEA